jgi:hypothetical protein
VSNDGNTVHVRRAHGRFAEQVAALQPGPGPQTHQAYPPYPQAGPPQYPPYPAAAPQYGPATQAWPGQARGDQPQ